MDPVPSAKTTSRGASTEISRDLVHSLPGPDTGIVDTDDRHVARFQSVHIGRVRNGKTCAAKERRVGCFSERVHDVQGASVL